MDVENRNRSIAGLIMLYFIVYIKYTYVFYWFLYLQESIAVLFHASLLGRVDVIKSSIASIRQLKGNDAEETCRTISMKRVEDDATAMHIAAAHGHVDAVRALLVSHRIVPNNMK